MVHEQLYRTEAGPVVDPARYLERLCGHIGTLAPEGVELEFTAPSFRLRSDRAAAVGTLINEIVANAYKHAFPQGRTGRVRIALQPLANGGAEVVIADDGIGLAAPLSEGRGLGMQVARTLAQQVGSGLEADPVTEGGLVLRFDIAPEAPLSSPA